jgi:hypothetical protein
MFVKAIVPCVLLMAAATSALGQEESAESSGRARSADATVIEGQPFSAVSYARRVRVLPNGRLRIISNERLPTRLARDSAGRLRFEIPFPVDPPELDCKVDMQTLPTCLYRDVLVVDPGRRMATRWQAGYRAGHVASTIAFSASQLSDVENATSVLPSNDPPKDLSQGVTITATDLGEEEIEGIPATGRRITTTRRKSGCKENCPPAITIHEVWTSDPLKLVVRIIDGDPGGEEVISGLEHISLAPDPGIFEPPRGWPVYVRSESDLLNKDVELLHSWFVTSPVTEVRH